MARFRKEILDAVDSIKDTALLGAEESLFQDIEGDEGDNVLPGTEDDDLIEGFGGNDTLNGLGGNDTLDGGDGDDELFGGTGEDILIGGEGDDILNGFTGFDTASYADAAAGVTVDLTITDAQDTVGAGTDTLIAIENLTGSAFDDTLTGSDNRNTLIGGAGDDNLDGGANNDILIGGAGADMIDGGEGFDTLSYADATAGITFNVNGQGSSGEADGDVFTNIERVIGSDFNDTIQVNVNASTNDFDDIIFDGGLGADFFFLRVLSGAGELGGVLDLSGGAGNDTMLITTFIDDDLGANFAASSFDGGEGVDTLLIAFAGALDFSVTNLSGFERITLTSSGEDHFLTFTAEQFSQITSVVTNGNGAQEYTILLDGQNSFSLAGLQTNGGNSTPHDFFVIGNETADTIIGSDRGDVITGNGGDDTLNGGAGNDTLDGGEGIDTASYAGTGAGVTVDLTITDAQDTLGAGTDILVDIENLIGTGSADTLTGDANANNLTGSAGSDALTGGAGDDTLDGGVGNDILDGGTGDDMLFGGTGNDTFIGGDGTDTAVFGGRDLADMQFFVNQIGEFLVVDQFGDQDILTGIEFVQFQDQTLTIAEVEALATFQFFFTQEDDVFDGGDDDDVLDGLGGNDTITGGLGNDTLIGGTGNDDLNGGAGEDTLDGGIGDDELFGGTGADVLIGGEGDDIIDGFTGVDTASYATTGNGVTVDLSIEGQQDTVGAGLDTLIAVENLIGSNFADTLTGNDGSNVLNGGNDDDVLDGGAGNDTLDGGQGNDTASYASALVGVTVDLNDTEAQNTGAGFDTLISIENLEGSAFDDALTGSLGEDTIEGGAGDDIIFGSGSEFGTSGIGLGSGQFARAANAGNVDPDTAIDITNLFAFNADPDIVNAERDGHVTILGTGDGDNSVHFYQVTVNTAGAAITLDADASGLVDFDNQVILFDANGNELAGDDLSNISEGAGGSINVFDAFLTFTVPEAGVYFIAISTFDDVEDTADPILDGESYRLHVSITEPENNPDVGDLDQDFLSGGDGNDTIFGGFGDDELIGDAGNDILNGDDGDDELSGDDGNDTLNGGEGRDFLEGGDGDDELFGDDGNDDLFGDAGNDTLSGGAGDDDLLGEAGNDTLNGGEGEDFLEGGDGNDTLFGGTNEDFLIGGAGDDILDGFTGVDTAAYVDAAAGVTVDLNITEAQDTGGDGIDTLLGIENLEGSDFDDVLNGSDNQNEINGGNGNDVIDGRENDDVIFGENGDDTLRGGDGNDEVRGGDGVDDVNGGAGDDELHGGGGNDTLFGGTGEDLLFGGGGDDVIDGFTGVDTVSYEFGGAVTVDLSNIEAQDTGGAGIDTIIRVENVTGSNSADVLTGNDGRNRLDGRNGDDVLDGGAGVDTAVFSQIDVADAQIFLDQNGNVTIISAEGTDSVSNFEFFEFRDQTLTLAQVAALGTNIVQGTEADEILDGSEGDDIINGEAGNDTLNGFGGDDILDGGEGVDTLNGDAGNDVLDGGRDNDVVNGGAGNDVIIIGSGVGEDVPRSYENDTVDGGTGTDTLDFSAYIDDGHGILIDVNLGAGSYTSFGGTQTVTGIENLIGSTLADTLTGDDGGNVISGGNGVDMLNGGAGNDTLLGGRGVDTLNGGDGNDFLNGGQGVDTVTGGAGDDTIFLAFGDAVDAIDGGEGNDTVDFLGLDQNFEINLATGLYFQTGSIVNIENVLVGSGDNIVTGTDGANIINTGDGEDILRGGAGDDDLNGGNDADRLEGGVGNDELFGGSGEDILIGGSGDDIIDGFNGFDTALYTGLSVGVTVDLDLETAQDTIGAGVDTLIRVENLIGSGQDDTLTGNFNRNRLEGGNGDDVLDGGAGNDTLLGGNGDDDLIGGTGADRLVGGAGADELLGGDQRDRLEGGADNDRLFGGDDVDRLLGGDGNDLLVGGEGTDFLFGGAGADRFDFNSLADSGVGPFQRDEIRDFNSAEGDTIDVSQIDADITTEGSQDFVFAEDGFTGTAGEMMIESLVRSGINVQLVSFDVDGDSIADMQLFVIADELDAGDFIL